MIATLWIQILSQQGRQIIDWKEIIPVLVIVGLSLLSGIFKRRQGKQAEQQKSKLPDTDSMSRPNDSSLPTMSEWLRKLTSSGRPVSSSQPRVSKLSPVHSAQAGKPGIMITRPRISATKPRLPEPSNQPVVQDNNRLSRPGVDNKVRVEKVTAAADGAVDAKGSWYGAAKQLGDLKEPNELARALIYSEILGKPLALRPPGGFEF